MRTIELYTYMFLLVFFFTNLVFALSGAFVFLQVFVLCIFNSLSNVYPCFLDK